MKLAIMQPYFFPYFGYFQLIASVDRFVVYDNIKFTKKGWINRNRMLQNGADVLFSLPLKGASDYLDIRERQIAAEFDRDRFLEQLKGAYRRAPFFEETFALVESVVRHEDVNLFRFLHHSILQTCRHLGVETPLTVSSEVPIDHTLKSQGKVLALCEALGADVYVNAIGGRELYSRDAFGSRGIDLRFIQSAPLQYPQFGSPFVPNLSIIDVMMFNPRDKLREVIFNDYELV